MLKKILTAASAVVLFIMQVLPVAAANDFPLSKSNSYTVTTTGGGTYEYTVPFTANYEITLAGAQGGSYGGSGGLAYTTTSTIRLNKGQKVKYVLSSIPSWSQSGSVVSIPGGKPSYCYIDGEFYVKAGGGGGRIGNNIAPNLALTMRVYGGDNTGYADSGIHWHTGNGKSGPYHSNTFPQIDSRDNTGGGCYTKHWHTHDSKCDYESWHTHEHCQYWVSDGTNENGESVGHWVTDHHCTPHHKHEGDTRNNHHAINCGYSQGQILNTGLSPSASACSGTYNSSAVNHSGAGSFTIKLQEQNTLYYKGGAVSSTDLYYRGGRADLVLKDDVVVYYKRR